MNTKAIVFALLALSLSAILQAQNPPPRWNAGYGGYNDYNNGYYGPTPVVRMWGRSYGYGRPFGRPSMAYGYENESWSKTKIEFTTDQIPEDDHKAVENADVVLIEDGKRMSEGSVKKLNLKLPSGIYTFMIELADGRTIPVYNADLRDHHTKKIPLHFKAASAPTPIRPVNQ